MIDEAARVLGYRFKNALLLAEALTHASRADHRLQSNERLEFLGDAILSFIVCEYLFQNFPDLLEGEMTKIKSAVVSRKVCAKVSRQINLSQMLNLGKGIHNSQVALPGSISAAVFEAIIAAIYLDGGMEPARRFVLEHLTPVIQEAAESTHQQNFKSVLQQYAQKNFPSIPAYILLGEKGPDHSKCFQVCVEIGGRRFEPAWGHSKKEAEQKAALNCLCGLQLATVDDQQRVELIHPQLEQQNPLPPNDAAPPDLDCEGSTGLPLP